MYGLRTVLAAVELALLGPESAGRDHPVPYAGVFCAVLEPSDLCED